MRIIFELLITVFLPGYGEYHPGGIDTENFSFVKKVYCALVPFRKSVSLRIGPLCHRYPLGFMLGVGGSSCLKH